MEQKFIHAHISFEFISKTSSLKQFTNLAESEFASDLDPMAMQIFVKTLTGKTIDHARRRI